jgi:hypothetical protein
MVYTAPRARLTIIRAPGKRADAYVYNTPAAGTA